MKKVTDPQLIAELNGQSQQSNRQPVSDPGLIAELNSSIEQPQEPMSKWEAVKQGFGIASDAVEGDAEFKDAGDYKDYMNQLAAKGH